jgi:transposase
VPEERSEFPKEALPVPCRQNQVDSETRETYVHVTIGLDPHKASNTIAVLDSDENVVFRRRFVNGETGFTDMMKQVASFDQRTWAVEGAAGMGRSIAQQLITANETVTDVPAKLAAQVRVYSTGHGRKTDTTDAISIAKAALRSKRVRPVVADNDIVALKLLVDRSREIVAMRV